MAFLFGVTSSLAGVDVKVNQDTDASVQNEPSITINRHFTGDPLNIVVAYNDIGKTLGISWSADSGKTWADTQLAYVFQTTGDPSVASDINGNVYACFLSFEGTAFYGKSGIFVCKSTDGGRIWSSPVKVDSLVYPGAGPPVKFADKCMMTVDTNSSSPYVNNIYVAWQRDDTNGQNSDIFFSRSTDGGLTFDAPLQVNDNSPQSAYAEGAFPFVGADGDVYVAWYDAYFRGHEPGSLYVDKSTDGGQAFGTDVKVANILTPPLYTFGNTGFKAKSFVSAAGNPNNSEDLYMTYISDPDGYFDKRIDNGKPPGALGSAPSDQPMIIRNSNYVYVAWQDHRNLPGGQADIYFNRSTDNGRSWDLPDKGPLDNTDTPGANKSERVRMSSSGTYVYAVWQDYRSAGGFVNVYFNRSSDYGKTWLTEQRIDTSTTASCMYPAVASTGNYVYVVWQDNTSGFDDIYFNHSTDNGTSWGTPTRIDLGDLPGANSSLYPRLACQGSNVYCLWKDDRTGGTYQAYFNYSTNNGVNWQSGSTMISPGTGICSLPLRRGLECTGSHVYACWEDDRDGIGISQVFFNRSTNSGVSWGTDIRVSDSTGNACYNPSMDIQGSYVYIGWEDRRISGFGEIFFDYSTDNGATWQKPDIGPLDPGAIGMPGMVVDIKSDGSNVYATWYDSRRFGPGSGDVFFSRSTNNGASWQGDVQINTGSQPFNLQNNYPVMAAGNGYVNIVWPDPRFFGLPNIYTNYSSDNGATWLTGSDEADVFCVRSTNGGASWQTPVTVNDDGTTYAQVLPWVVVKSNGLVDISYYHFRMSPLNAWAPGAELRMTTSSDGGVSFAPSSSVQDTVVTPTTQWVGEYNGMAVLDSFVFTVFTDFEQTGNSDIFVDKSVNPSANEVKDETGTREGLFEFTLLQNYPNPFNQTTKIQFTLAKPGFVTLNVYDILGRKVGTLVSEHLSSGYKSVLWDGKNESGKDVASGIYFYQLRFRDFSETRKLVLLK
jgi:hypothetical protein